jgi:hypothetical protein
MSYADIAIVAALFLFLIFTIVAFGLGHKRWSIVSVVATFLVALTIPTYLYFSAQLLQHEWRWAQAARKLQEKIARVRDAQEPSQAEDRRGALVKVEGMASIRELQQARDRWERALTRIDNWRGRHWSGASFTPPAADGQTGTITLPAGGARPVAEGEPPAAAATDPADVAADPLEGAAPATASAAAIDPGTTVYVFDDAPYARDGGGRYLGGFLVQAVDTVDGRQTLTVQQIAPRDDYDTKVWSRAYDAVSVYTELPNDRWLAFSETQSMAAGEEPSDDDARIAPPQRKRVAEILDELVPEFQSESGGLAKYMNFLDRVKQHALSATDVPEAIDKAEWPDLRERIKPEGDALPGEYWAEVTFNERADMLDFLGLGPDDLRDEAGLSIEMDLASAFDQADAGKLTIDQVFYRRPLVDGETLIHGTALPANDGNLVSDGLAALRQVLQREIVALDAAKKRLDTGLARARAELTILDTQKQQFGDDLQQWNRDLTAATRLADQFEVEAKKAASRLAETEQQIVDLGRAVVTEIGKAVQEVDRAAPAAGTRGAATPAASF